MKKRALLFTMYVICCALVLTGCVRVEQLVPEQGELCLAPGDSAAVQVQVLPEDAHDKSVFWASGDELIASVDQDGVITAQNAGDCTVTVRAKGDGSVFAEIGVVVLPHVQQITAEETELTMKPGESQTVSVQMQPQVVFDDTVTWTSSDEKIAKVDQQGAVTAQGAGKCTITVRSVVVEDVFAQIEVTVLSLPRSVQANQESVSLTQGGSVGLSAQVMPEDAYDRTVEWKSSDETVAEVDGEGNVTAKGAGTCTITVSSKAVPQVSAEIAVTVAAPAPAPGYTRPGNSVTGVTYINGILIANKTYALPSNYNPGEDPEAVAALWEMFAAAQQEEGLTLFVKSGFRSYIDQYIIYNDWVALDGQAEADRYSARPGHSEHQSGLAFDLNDVSQAFASSPEGIWLAENCYKYGFIIRYPQDKEHITGYIYEPWHVRYLGKEVAKAVYESGLCLEEYLGITSQYAE